MTGEIRGRGGLGATAQWVLWALIVALSVLPLIRTLNEFMTTLFIRTQASTLIERFVVPPMARVIGAILRFVFGVEAVVDGGSIFLITRGLPYELYLSWNCVGWQSLVILLLSMVTGIQGEHSVRSKLKCVALGLEGIVVVNVLRIVLSAVLLLRWGYTPAIAFHDHLALAVTYLWLGAFWYISNEFILEPPDQAESRPIAERVREAMRGLRGLLPDFIYGRRGIGLATMTIILTLTALSGAAVLSAKVPAGGDLTTLSFEYVADPVVVCGISTNRILTHPDHSSLGDSAKVDIYEGGFTPQWVEMWDFYLHGPLEASYTLTGSMRYAVWMHLQLLPHGMAHYRTYIRFTLYDVDEGGTAAEVRSDTFRIKLTETPKEHAFEGDPSPPHTFEAGHTLRLSIEVFDGLMLRYVLEYDSPDRHSYVDLAGIVISENATRLIYLALIIPAATAALTKREERKGRAPGRAAGREEPRRRDSTPEPPASEHRVSRPILEPRGGGTPP